MQKLSGLFRNGCIAAVASVSAMGMAHAAEGGQGESVNILLNFREFLQASCEHSVQIVTAHRRYFLLASDARFA